MTTTAAAAVPQLKTLLHLRTPNRQQSSGVGDRHRRGVAATGDTQKRCSLRDELPVFVGLLTIGARVHTEEQKTQKQFALLTAVEKLMTANVRTKTIAVNSHPTTIEAVVTGSKSVLLLIANAKCSC